MATQPVLAGTTLQHPKKGGYKEQREWKGAWARSANGVYEFDRVGGANNTQTIIDIEWQNISTTDKDAIRTAYDAVFTAGSATFITPENLNYTVIINPESDRFEYAGTTRANNGALVWNCRLSLLRVA